MMSNQLQNVKRGTQRYVSDNEGKEEENDVVEINNLLFDDRADSDTEAVNDNDDLIFG